MQNNPRPLDETRAEITAIDQQIQQLFLRRMACAEQVAAYKLKTGDAILKPDREQYLLETLGAQAPDGLRQEYVSMLKSVMRVSRKHQYETILSCEPARLELTLAPRCDQPARVVYQGLPASYQAQAAAAMFPDAKEVSHVPTFEDVFRAVSEGRADAGVVPVENSTVGTIHEACDLLVQYDLHISHSHVDHIYNCLCACPGATLQSVRTAYSIKPALGQCQNFLKEHGLEQQEAANTAVAAQMVAASGDLTLAAVCSEQAAALYGLTVRTLGRQPHFARLYPAPQKRLARGGAVGLCRSRDQSHRDSLPSAARDALELPLLHRSRGQSVRPCGARDDLPAVRRAVHRPHSGQLPHFRFHRNEVTRYEITSFHRPARHDLGAG